MNSAVFTVKIIDKPVKSFFKKDIAVIEVKVKIIKNKVDANSKNILNLSIWYNLSSDLLKNPKINDYFIIEGYISVRKNLSTLEIYQPDKQIDISILNMYSFT
jgi:hypothetical protein